MPPPPAQAAAEPSAAAPARIGAVVGFMAFVELTSGIFQGFVPPLLPSIAGLHQVSAGDIALVNSLQLLAAAVCVPILTKLGDMYGHRRMLRIALAVVVLGSLLVAFAPSYELLLLGRVLTGPLSAWLPLEIAITRDKVQGDAGRRAIGLLVGCLTGGVALGSLIAGPAEDLLGGVRPALLVLTVLAVLAFCCALFLIPETSTRAARKIDGLGFLGLAVALLLLQYGLSQTSRLGWGSSTVLGCLLAGLVVLLAWGWWELRTAHPAVDLRVIGHRSMWPVQLAAMLFAIALFGSQSPNSTFLAARSQEAGYGFGLDTTGIALLLLPSQVASVIGAALHARIAARIGLHRTIATGAALLALGYGALCVAHGSEAAFLVTVTLTGCGIGLMSGAFPSLVAERSPAGQTGIAAGVYNTLRTLAGGVAGGLFAVVLSNILLADSALPSAEAYRIVWLACALSGLGAAGLVLFARRRTTD
ncbi:MULTISPECIES: MFS transporter [unclassified Streptomyces]|uniref:MFS transporter n=1 Tax=unclassified Streptomyces TaxID=2593676 RepID=UPI00278C0C47|nr:MULTISPECIES: MFS transporter [unclassified Streptomyces]